MPNLILASASPRRKELLAQLKIAPNSTIPADIDEAPLKNELPKNYATRMAFEKASKIAQAQKNAFILSADTVVSCGRRILPKAETDEEVQKCLKILSGKKHSVLTAIYIIAPDGRKASKLVLTKITFKKLTAAEIKNYIKNTEGIGKAGGYAIQGLAAAFVKSINGSYSSVVGLPLYETRNALEGLGYANDK